MKKTTFLSLIVFLMIGSCSLVLISVLFPACHSNIPKNKISENFKTLNVLYDEFYEGTHRLYPLNSTFYGDNRYNDLLPNDISQSYIMKIKSFYEKFKEKLSKVDSNNISTEDKINVKILNWECDMQLESFNLLLKKPFRRKS